MIINYQGKGRIYTGNGANFTYTELNQMSNRWAHFLEKGGVDHSSNVLVIVNKDFYSIVKIISIIKCGATFIPVDSATPDVMIDKIIEENDAYLLDQSGILHYKGTIISIFDDHVYSKTYTPYEWKKKDILYIIYTSGTTGVRKGTKIYYESFMNYIRWFMECFSIDDKDSTYIITSLAFDLSYSSLFTALYAGASIYLPTSPKTLDFTELERYINNDMITYLKITPSIMRVLNQLKLERSESFRLVLCGGENIEPKQVLSFRNNVNPKMIVVNHYGPTETTVGCCYKKIDFEEEKWKAYENEPTIGKPIRNVQITINNEENEIIESPGEIGELYIYGKCVGAGYVGKDQGGFKVGCYHSGDYGYYNSDGEIVLVGRKDKIIKRNGYRVSISEIQNALDSVKIWNRAVCITGKDGRLIVYYESVKELGYELITGTLKALLPTYLVPACYIRVERIPITNNGKIDFSAMKNKKSILPSLDYQTEKERSFYELWDHMFPLGDTKYYELKDHSLYELGISSLQAMEFICRYEEEYHRKIDISLMLSRRRLREIVEELKDEAKLNTQCFRMKLNTEPVHSIEELIYIVDQMNEEVREQASEEIPFSPTLEYYTNTGDQIDNVLCTIIPYNDEEKALREMVTFFCNSYLFHSAYNYSTKIISAVRNPYELKWVIPFIISDDIDIEEMIKWILSKLYGFCYLPYIFFVLPSEQRIVIFHKHACILRASFSKLMNTVRHESISGVNMEVDLAHIRLINGSVSETMVREAVLKEFSLFRNLLKTKEMINIFGENSNKKYFSKEIMIDLSSEENSESDFLIFFLRTIEKFYGLNKIPLKIFKKRPMYADNSVLGDFTDFDFLAFDMNSADNQLIGRVAELDHMLNTHNSTFLQCMRDADALHDIPQRSFYLNVVYKEKAFRMKKDNDNIMRYYKHHKKNIINGCGMCVEINDNKACIAIAADFDITPFCSFWALHTDKYFTVLPQ